ncbi:paraquat-inducible protein A [Rhizobium rosettiformans]|uniref:Paraquat-inducible protein A n=2 Tax=Rhizobium rosettiformans TaxID=1368430 RepID=A0A4S8Q4V9_9HYPH|nr:paraquat-inducible protein A [Rhizobium rosettiformans]MBB5274850.1 paraquat-inducible protein A [Rhizobium rosettiformans]THV39303.1 paraquat-inducible protein A [Rhizobium rosettiformans W3]
MLVWLKALLLVGASFAFALGITLPLMRFESFYLFSTDASLVEVILSLWSGGDGLLALLVGLVSIAFPLVKLLLVAAEQVAKEGAARAGMLDRLVPVLSKWSMMDVLLVAIVIFATKTSGLAQAFTQPGLWFYAGSSLAVVALSALGRKAEAQES